MSKMVTKKLCLLMIAIVVLVVASVESAPTKDDEEQSLNKEYDEGLLVPKSRILAVPSALTRFLLYSPQNRPIDRRLETTNLLGLKRSSSGFDMLTMGGFGKRSLAAAPMAEYINLEPFFGRQYNSRHDGL